MNIGFGEFIKRHRILSGFRKQSNLAHKSGLSAATISRIEKEIQVPEVKTLQQLALCLHSTTYKELMDVCGYSTEGISMNVQCIEISDNNSFMNLSLDNEPLSEIELEYVISNLRMIRKLYTKNNLK